MNPLRTLLLAAFVAIIGSQGPATPEPRYLLFNIAPGHDWKQEDPESLKKILFKRLLFYDVANTLHVAKKDDIRIGVAFTLSILNTSHPILAEDISSILQGSLESGIPVMVGLDGQNWWEERPDLWNWWDPEAPGYDPSNVFNVEWTGWSPSLAVKIGWRNWGTQVRVPPAPNLASPRFLESNTSALKALVPIVADWYKKLPPEKKYLLAGLKVGWEAGIGYNAYYYPDGNRFLERWPDNDLQDPTTGLDSAKGLSGGLLQLGYAAVTAAGFKKEGEITRDDIGRVTRDYLALLSKVAFEAGMPRDLIYTHQGGVCPPWEKHLPFWPAINEWSCPGWSFYWGVPSAAGNLKEELERAGQSRWGAAEWWWSGKHAQEWADNLTQTLKFQDCRFICIYNWNQGGVESLPDALRGIRMTVDGWR